MTEFAYNNSINRTTSLNLFEIVTDFKPKKLIDLILMAHHSRVSDSTSAFTSHICALHEEIRDNIMKNNADYKASVDLQSRLRTFNVRRSPPGTVEKLHARSAGPFQILKIINSNVYVDFPPEFGISCTFNVEDLVSYKDTFDTPSDPFMDEPTCDLISERRHYLHFL